MILFFPSILTKIQLTCWDDAIESDVNFRFIVSDEREQYHFTTSGDLKKSIFFLKSAITF